MMAPPGPLADLVTARAAQDAAIAAYLRARYPVGTPVHYVRRYRPRQPRAGVVRAHAGASVLVRVHTRAHWVDAAEIIETADPEDAR